MTMRHRFGSWFIAAVACASPTFAGEPTVVSATQQQPEGGLNATTMQERRAVEAAHAWWDAFARGDVVGLASRTAPALSLTLSVGTRFNRETAFAQASRHVGSAYVATAWSDDRVHFSAPGVAVVTSAATEGVGRMQVAYRYLAVMEEEAGTWRISAAQSTRVLAPARRVTLAETGPLSAYAGSYRTPQGAVLQVTAQADGLVLGEPGGGERRLEPIGRDLFELVGLQSASGVLRFLFVRDESGSLAGLTRLGPEITTFPRVVP